jgi:hypothetical protein
VALAWATVALLGAAPAGATELVDDPAEAARIPAAAQAVFAAAEAEYQAWLQAQVAQTAAPAPRRVGGGATANARLAVDAPYRILSTVSHKQIRNDFCVPATTTIIDHFLRGADAHWTQKKWAAYAYAGVPLWTDAYGGSMWVMAMGLTQVTGKTYNYTAGNTVQSVYNRTEYTINTKGRPVGYGVRIIASNWPTYKIDHTGHIMGGRGFDWRNNTIRIDDPYPENAPPPLGYGDKGGDTYGKKSYARAIVAGGVVASASQQVVN